MQVPGKPAGSAAAPSGGREPSDFAARLDREARRRGLHDAAGPVAVSDGAERLPNACEGPFGGGFVPGLFQCLERASDAVKAILPAGAERDRRFAEVKADVRAGRAAKAVRERRRRGRMPAVRAAAQALRNALVGEGRQRHVDNADGTVGLRVAGGASAEASGAALAGGTGFTGL